VGDRIGQWGGQSDSSGEKRTIARCEENSDALKRLSPAGGGGRKHEKPAAENVRWLNHSQDILKGGLVLRPTPSERGIGEDERFGTHRSNFLKGGEQKKKAKAHFIP